MEGGCFRGYSTIWMAFSMDRWIDGSGLGLALAHGLSQAIRLSELYVQSLADLFEAINIVVAHYYHRSALHSHSPEKVRKVLTATV